jgi:hypothetical protein
VLTPLTALHQTAGEAVPAVRMAIVRVAIAR